MIPPPVPLPEITYSTTPAPAAGPVVEPAIEPLPAEPTAEPVSGACSARAGAHSQPLPFLAIGGLTSLLAGLGLGLRRRRN